MAQTSTSVTSPAPAGAEIDGAKVRELRKLSGKTVTVLADTCEITSQYLSMIERGDRPTVSPAVFARICDALGVTDRRQLLRSAVS